MYRRRVENLPKDPVYPHDLKKLGYKIDENDCITSLSHPGEYFQFFITNNERYNDVQREAMHDCARAEVIKRLTALGIKPLYLPSLTPDPPASFTPALPIACTPLDLLRRKRRIVVIINRAREDLAVLSYRALSRSGGISGGSAVSIVEELRVRAEKDAQKNRTVVEEEMPGVVILNTGQLLYSHTYRKAVTPVTWDAMPRASATHPPANVHEEWNRIEGNKNFEEHIHFVFKELLSNAQYVDSQAELYIVGLLEGGDQVVKHISDSDIHDRVAALALTAPVSVYASTSDVPLNGNDGFLRFLSQRARAWKLSNHPLNTPETNAFSVAEITQTLSDDEQSNEEVNLYPEVSGGELQWDESIITTSYKCILDWFEEVKNGGGTKGYRNQVLEIPPEVMKQKLVGSDVETFGW